MSLKASFGGGSTVAGQAAGLAVGEEAEIETVEGTWGGEEGTMSMNRERDGVRGADEGKAIEISVPMRV